MDHYKKTRTEWMKIIELKGRVDWQVWLTCFTAWVLRKLADALHDLSDKMTGQISMN